MPLKKLAELTLLKEGLTKGAAAIDADIHAANQALLTLKELAKGTNADLTAERNNLSSKDFKRPVAFEERLRIQNESLGLPLLPTNNNRQLPVSLLKCAVLVKNGAKMSGQMQSMMNLLRKKQKDGLIFKKRLAWMYSFMENLNVQTWLNTSVKNSLDLPLQNSLGFNLMDHAA